MIATYVLIVTLLSINFSTSTTCSECLRPFFIEDFDEKFECKAQTPIKIYDIYITMSCSSDSHYIKMGKTSQSTLPFSHTKESFLQYMYYHCNKTWNSNMSCLVMNYLIIGYKQDSNINLEDLFSKTKHKILIYPFFSYSRFFQSSDTIGGIFTVTLSTNNRLWLQKSIKYCIETFSDFRSYGCSCDVVFKNKWKNYKTDQNKASLKERFKKVILKKDCDIVMINRNQCICYEGSNSAECLITGKWTVVKFWNEIRFDFSLYLTTPNISQYIDNICVNQSCIKANLKFYDKDNIEDFIQQVQETLMKYGTTALISHIFYSYPFDFANSSTMVILCKHKNIIDCKFYPECFLSLATKQAEVTKIHVLNVTDQYNTIINLKSGCDNNTYQFVEVTEDDVERAFKNNSKSIKWDNNNIKKLENFVDKKMNNENQDDVNSVGYGDRIILFVDTSLSNVEPGTNYSSESISVLSMSTNKTNIQESFIKPGSFAAVSLTWNSKNSTKITIGICKLPVTNTSRTKVLSDVAIIISDSISRTENFTVNLIFSFLHEDSEKKLQCTHQNKSTMLWETTYCKTINSTYNNGSWLVSCSCNHLTSFAVIFNPYDTSIDSKEITICSITLSIISLLAAIVGLGVLSYLSYSFRNKGIYLLKSSLFLSFSFLYISFIVSNAKNWLKMDCTIIGAILHYTALTYYFQLLMISICSILVVKNPTIKLKNNHVIGPLIVSYVVPAVIVILLGYLAPIQYEKCVVNGIARHLTLTLIGSLILVFNIASCIYVYRVSFNSTSKKTRKNKHILKIKLLLSIIVLYGLPFLIQFLLIEALQPTIDWIFTVVNGLQGFFLGLMVIGTEEKFRTKFKASLNKSKKIRRNTNSKTTKNVTHIIAQPSLR